MLKRDFSSSLSYKTALVTGAAGFVGKYLVRALLEKGIDVTVITRNPEKLDSSIHGKVHSLVFDLNDVNLPLLSYDVVFHLAALADLAECGKNPLKAYKENVLATLNLLTKSTSSKKFVYVSTLGVYGEPRRFPIKESDLALPIEPYAASKLAAEACVQGFCTSKKVPFVIARLFNVYGPDQDSRFVIPRIVSTVMANAEPELRNLDSTRDFIYISDAVHAFMLLGMPTKEPIYNVGTGKETSIQQILQKLEKLINKPISFKVVNDSNASSVKRSVADITLLSEEMHWRPTVSLEEGLKHVAHYHELRRNLQKN